MLYLARPLKTCPQGVLQAQYEKKIFCTFTTSYLAWPDENSPLKPPKTKQKRPQFELKLKRKSKAKIVHKPP